MAHNQTHNQIGQVDPLLEVVGHDLKVPLLNGRSVRHVNFDNAASTPALTTVADHIAEVLPSYASVHRGAGWASQLSTTLYEQARADIGAFVGARADDVVVLVRNTTDALNLLASCVPAGAGVLYLDIEHHANLLPWQARPDAHLVTAKPTAAATLDALDEALAQTKPALVAVSGASNVTGEALPLDQVGALAHAAGARVAVDGAQLVPHKSVDIATTQIDYLAFSGHKLYAPFGAGALVGRRDWLDAGPPYLAGGGAVTEVAVDTAAWARAPQRHEAGSPNVIGVAALAQACRTLAGVEPATQRRHEAIVRAGLVEVAERHDLPVLGIFDDHAPTIAVVSVLVPGRDPGVIAARLSAEYGVSVRNGRFCAHPLLSRFAASAGAIRMSAGVGTARADIDRLDRALTEVLADAAGDHAYAMHDGAWTPKEDARPRPSWLTSELLSIAPPCAQDPAI